MRAFGRGYHFLALVALFSLLANALEVQAQERFRTTGVADGDTLNVRSAPKSDAPVVGKIPAHTTGIVRVGECKSWCRVRHGTVEGWVDRRFLTTESPVPGAIEVTAVSTNPIGDCNSDDVTRRLAGCTAIIKDSAAGVVERAIAHSRRSDAHLIMGSLEEVIADRVKAYELQHHDATYKTRLGQAFQLRAGSLFHERADRALADYAEAIILDPTSHEAFVGRSVVHLRKGDYDSAIADLRSAERIDAGKDVYRIAVARLYEVRGHERLLKNEFDGAIGDLTAVIQMDPKRASAYLNRAAAHDAKKDSASALTDYSEAIRINPGDAIPHVRRGELRRRQSNAEEALKDFDEALRLDSSNLVARMMRGLTREEAKQFDEAAVDYRAVLQIEPLHKFAREGLTRLGAPLPSRGVPEAPSKGGLPEAKPELSGREKLPSKASRPSCEPPPNESHGEMLRRWRRC